MLEEIKCCNICPYKCNVDRLNGQIGKCRCTDKIKIALTSLHKFEEPCISGVNRIRYSVFFAL